MIFCWTPYFHKFSKQQEISQTHLTHEIKHSEEKLGQNQSTWVTDFFRSLFPNTKYNFIGYDLTNSLTSIRYSMVSQTVRIWANTTQLRHLGRVLIARAQYLHKL